MSQMKVFGRWHCLDCGREIPYIYVDVPAMHATNPDREPIVLCFRCRAKEKLRNLGLNFPDLGLSRRKER
jgi:hypothetical protein